MDENGFSFFSHPGGCLKWGATEIVSPDFLDNREEGMCVIGNKWDISTSKKVLL